MEETQKFFETTPVDRDATLITEVDRTLATPRFDEGEAQVARPVVPLADSRPVKRRRRQWPIALVLISALTGGVVSLFAFRLYQQQSRVAETETGNQQATNAAPTPEPTPLAKAAATVIKDQAQTEPPAIVEESHPAKEGVEISDAGATRKADPKPALVRRDEREDEAKPTTTAASPRTVEARTRRAESSSPAAPRPVEARREDVLRDDRTDEDIIAERRERRRERREQRREQQRAPKRNIDRIKDIFEGAPPA